MELEKWKSLLNWNSVPPFGTIHKLSPEKFEEYYYLPDRVKEVVDTIYFSLEEKYGNTNTLIIGEPGSGKTTFLYYLVKRLAEHSAILSQYSFSILHINRFSSTSDAEKVIEHRVLGILQSYFAANDLIDIFNKLTGDDTILREKINRIEDFIILEKDRFKKQLIIIIDDIDETDEVDVERNLKYLFGLLECEQIPKWLVVRNTSLDHYKRDFISFIETKFGRSIAFPRVDLYGVLNQRIMAANPKGTNPYLQPLCAMMVQVFNNDLRRAVANAAAFLEHLSAPAENNYSAEFIYNYFAKSFTRVMVAINIFPNIYRDSYSPHVPLEKDVFLTIALHNTIPKNFIDKLGSSYRSAFSTSDGGKYAPESFLVSVDQRGINIAVEYLINHRIIERREAEKNLYRLTPRGQSFARFVTERLYTDSCEAQCREMGINKHRMFWKLARQYLRFAGEE